MTTETRQRSEAGTVSYVATFIVTNAMVDAAIRRRPSTKKQSLAMMLADPELRAKVRRNIAIGIHCGSYWPYFS